MRVMNRTEYHNLSEDAQTIVDFMRRDLADKLAKADGLSFDEVHESVIHLHELGYLTLVKTEDGIGLVPAYEGEPI